MHNKSYDILIAGVGGQGTILASKVLARTAQLDGCDVKVAEVHGMAQRGGSVVSQVRLGEKIHSPLIPTGSADYLVAFECLEARRWQPSLKPGGILFLNDQVIEPTPVLMGLADYPKDLKAKMEKEGPVRIFDALELARRAGTPRAVNIVLLGALSTELEISEDSFKTSIEENVPSRFTEANLKAFRLGQEAVS